MSASSGSCLITPLAKMAEHHSSALLACQSSDGHGKIIGVGRGSCSGRSSYKL